MQPGLVATPGMLPQPPSLSTTSRLSSISKPSLTRKGSFDGDVKQIIGLALSIISDESTKAQVDNQVEEERKVGCQGSEVILKILT